MSDSHYKYPKAGLNFGELLQWCLDHGIRPDGKFLIWNKKEFAANMPARGDGARKSLDNWLQNRHPPLEYKTIQKMLFNNSDYHNQLNDILYNSYLNFKNYKNTESSYHDKSIVDLVWRNVENKIGLISKIEDPETKNIDHFAWLISEHSNISQTEARSIVEGGRRDAFNKKYGNRLKIQDERHILGIGKWNKEFNDLLAIYQNIEKLSILVVGIGCGLEGVDIYDKYEEFYAVDLSADALATSQRFFPRMKIVNGSAELLPERLAHSIDLYVSLKTFQSSFFDIEKAVSECRRVLKPNGISIISVPKGYYNEGEYTPGLAPINYNIKSIKQLGNYGIIDKMLPFYLINKIIKMLYKNRMHNIELHTGAVEIYIVSKKA